jgi:hypothetical protein
LQMTRNCILDLLKAQIRSCTHMPLSLKWNSSKLPKTLHFQVNLNYHSLTKTLSNKHSIYFIFSAENNPSSHTHSKQKNSHSLSNSHFLHFGTFTEKLQRARAGFVCFITCHHFGTCCKPEVTTVSHYQALLHQYSSMADLGCS